MTISSEYFNTKTIMLKFKTMTLYLFIIFCLCSLSHAATEPPAYTTELGSYNEISSNSLLESLWKKEWGSLPKNPADVNTILWYSLSQSTGNVDIEIIDRLRECLSAGKNCKDVLPMNLIGPLALLTNCTVNTALSPAFCNALQKCTDTSGLLSSLGIDVSTVTVSELDELLPILVYQISEGQCQTQGVVSQSKKVNSKPTPAEIWGYGILFVTVISACSLAGVLMIPLIGRRFYQNLLTILVGLAMGSLAASALFHLIPEAFHLHKLYGNNDFLFISLYVLLGIWAFFIVERLIKIIMGKCSKGKCSKNDDKKPLPMSGSGAPMLCDSDHECVNGSHTNSVIHQIYKSQDQNRKSSSGHGEVCKSPSKCRKWLRMHPLKGFRTRALVREVGCENPSENCPSMDDHHSRQIEFKQGEDSVIKTVAWMIIFGDGFHNFIDGVSIGAAFSESILTGVSISLAVMCEELPHELGDFAVLLNAGMSMKQAVMYNFLSATTCYLGLVFGILLGEFTQNSSAIFALAAGMFLYISLSDMIPEMNKVASEATKDGASTSLFVLLLQNIGIFLGVATLFLLAYFEDYMVL